MHIKIFVAFLLVFSFASSAQQSVIGLELEYRLRQDGSAHYNKMWQRLQQLGANRGLEVLPLKRAFRDFSPQGTSCLFPTTISSLTTTFPQFKQADLITTESVDYVLLKVMTRPGEPVIKDLAQLNGKRVALWNGLDPAIFLKDLDVTVETTTDEAVRLKMLNSRRVDAILGFLPDTLLAADALGMEHPNHAGAYQYFTTNRVSMVCFDSPENRQYVEQFNKALLILKQTGELKRILGPHVTLSLDDDA